MSRPPRDLQGFRFGNLTVIDSARNQKEQVVRICLCDCGAVCTKRSMTRARMCEKCSRAINDARIAEYARTTFVTHGHARRGQQTKEFRAWSAMIARCTYPSQQNYGDYGGRGIAVCSEWSASFEAFLSHVGAAPGASHSLDRIDVNGHYEPGNVRWATSREQARNKRVQRLIEYCGESMTLTEWAERLGVKVGTMWSRIKFGRDLATGKSSARVTDHSRHVNPLLRGAS
jgi:hypothetical protein